MLGSTRAIRNIRMAQEVYFTPGLQPAMRYLPLTSRSVDETHSSMAQNLYAIVVVVIRLWSVFLVLSGLYGVILETLIVHGSGPALIALVWPLIAGVILWFLAKPIGRLVTNEI